MLVSIRWRFWLGLCWLTHALSFSLFSFLCVIDCILLHVNLFFSRLRVSCLFFVLFFSVLLSVFSKRQQQQVDLWLSALNVQHLSVALYRHAHRNTPPSFVSLVRFVLLRTKTNAKRLFSTRPTQQQQQNNENPERKRKKNKRKKVGRQVCRGVCSSAHVSIRGTRDFHSRRREQTTATTTTTTKK